MWMAYNDKMRTLYENLKQQVSFLLCVLHHVDISHHMATLTYGDYSKCLTPEGGWRTKPNYQSVKVFCFIYCPLKCM